MNKRLVKNDKGITILELMVAMTIFVVVLTLSVGAFISLIRLQGQTETMTDTQQNGRVAIEQVVRLLRQAETVEIIGDDGDDLQTIIFNENTCFKVDEGALKKYDYVDSECKKELTLTSTGVSITKFNFQRFKGIPPTLKINLTVESNDPLIGPGSSQTDVLILETSVLLTGLK